MTQLSDVTNFQSLAGKGVVGNSGGHKVAIDNRARRALSGPRTLALSDDPYGRDEPFVRIGGWQRSAAASGEALAMGREVEVPA